MAGVPRLGWGCSVGRDKVGQVVCPYGVPRRVLDVRYSYPIAHGYRAGGKLLLIKER